MCADDLTSPPLSGRQFDTIIYLADVVDELVTGPFIDEARQLAQQDLANARRSGIPRGIGRAHGTLPSLDHHNSVDLLRAAVAALERSPGPLDLGRALTALALLSGAVAIESRRGGRSERHSRSRPAAVLCRLWNERERKRWLLATALVVLVFGCGRAHSERVSRRPAGRRRPVQPGDRAGLVHYDQDGGRPLGNCYSKLDISSRVQLTNALGLSNKSLT